MPRPRSARPAAGRSDRSSSRSARDAGKRGRIAQRPRDHLGVGRLLHTRLLPAVGSGSHESAPFDRRRLGDGGPAVPGCGMTDAPVALVTGASRGIGKASAIALAEAGFDVAIAARTVHEGDSRSEPNSVRGDDPVVTLPGSLESTAAEITARGRRALIVPMDLLDLTSVEAAPATVLAEWGRIDVLFNNGIYQGRGTMDRILDLQMADIDNADARQLRASAPTHPARRAAHDRARARPHHQHGVGVGPSRSARSRGSGRLGHRLRGIESRVRAGRGRDRGRVRRAGRARLQCRSRKRHHRKAPTAAPGRRFRERLRFRARRRDRRIVAWLASSDEALRFAGKWVYAPKLCADRGLLPGWPPEGVTP